MAMGSIGNGGEKTFLNASLPCRDNVHLGSGAHGFPEILLELVCRILEAECDICETYEFTYSMDDISTADTRRGLEVVANLRQSRYDGQNVNCTWESEHKIPSKEMRR
jgi:hypothetical protein